MQRIHLLAIGFTVFILITLVITLNLLSRRQSTPLRTTPSVNDTVTSENNNVMNKNFPTPLPAPKISFDEYDLRTSKPQLPAELKTYYLKTNWTETEIKNFSLKLGLNSIQRSSNSSYYLISNLTDKNHRGSMLFDAQTGSFSFQSWGMHRPQLLTENTDPKFIANLYLQEIGMSDGTVICKHTYQRKEDDNTVYVRCYRDWEKMGGIPILSYPGILNVSENTPLSSLQLGIPDATAPVDESVINTSYGINGRYAPDDFNVITFGIDKNTLRILSINSNIRLIDHIETHQNSDLVTPQEAYNKFIAHGAELSFPLPAGEGIPDWTTVFSGNKAHATKATITDYLIVYPEKPQSVPQDKLTAYYMIRGTATLDSGYTSKFVELLPITKKGLSILPGKSISNVAGVSTQKVLAQKYDEHQVGSQKQGTNWMQGQQPTPTITPTTTKTLPSVACELPTEAKQAGKEVSVYIPGLGQSTLVFSLRTSFLKSASGPIPDMTTVRKSFFSAEGPVVKQYFLNVVKKAIANGLNSQSVNTEADVYNLFSQIDPLTSNTGLSATDGTTCTTGEIAPLLPGCPDYTDARFKNLGANYEVDPQYVQSVSSGVAKLYLHQAKSNALTTAAQEDNLFPPETLFQFYKIYRTYTNNILTQKEYACYISGASPSLFVYSDNTHPLSIKPLSPLTYNYPAFKDNTWNITTTTQGLISLIPTTHNLLPTTYLYYEYNPTNISFTQPQEGWIIRKTQLNDWIKNTFAKQLELNQQETDQMLNEVQNALNKSTTHNLPPTTYLKLSLADEDELNEQLPLQINPQPTSLRRIHLLISVASPKTKVKSAAILPISRSAITVIEIGARVLD